MKIQFDKFIFICFLSLFLPAFFIPLGLLVPLYLLACIVITGYYLCFHFYKSKMFVNDVMNKTPFKYFICFILWIILDLLFLVIIGNVSLIKAISAIVIILVGYFILYYLTPLLVCQRLIKKHQLYKIIVTAIYIIFLWGIIAHIAVLYNIHSIQIIQSIISNIDDVDLCAVVKVPDKDMLYVNKAYIVLNDNVKSDETEKEKIINLFNEPVKEQNGDVEQLKWYEKPKYVEFVKELPRRKGTEKVDYALLEKDALKELDDKSDVKSYVKR